MGSMSMLARPVARDVQAEKRMRIEMQPLDEVNAAVGCQRPQYVDSMVICVSDDAYKRASEIDNNEEQCEILAAIPGVYWMVHPCINGCPCFRQEISTQQNAPNNKQLMMFYFAGHTSHEGWYIADKAVDSMQEFRQLTVFAYLRGEVGYVYSSAVSNYGLRVKDCAQDWADWRPRSWNTEHGQSCDEQPDEEVSSSAATNGPKSCLICADCTWEGCDGPCQWCGRMLCWVCISNHYWEHTSRSPSSSPSSSGSWAP